MEFEFDKEIDSLLRQTARTGEFAFENSPSSVRSPHSVHLDADEISAFAENALPEKARSNGMEHLADCTRCRKILADVILFNSEIESEIIHQKETKTIVAVPKIPWYKQLFAFPNLAYTMGAMALLFSGILGYVLFQSVSQEKNSSVAQMEKPAAQRPTGAKGASSEGDSDYSETPSATPLPNTAANSNTAMSNSTAFANKSVAPTPSMSSNSAANSNMASPPSTQEPRGETEKTKKDSPKEATTDNSVTTADKEKKPENKTAEESQKSESSSDNVSSRQLEVLPAPVARNQTIYPDTNNVQRGAQNSTADAARGGTVRDDDSKNAAKKSDAVKGRMMTSKTIGERTFRNINGIWTDTNYSDGTTKNIKRGSDDYKKLDSGLRSIAENLGGTIIVVWNTKAYKIQ